MKLQMSKGKDSYSALTNARGTGMHLVSFVLRAISKERTKVVLVTLS